MNNKKVSIIVTTYLEKTKPYLDLCIESIRNLNYPKENLEVILVGKESYQPTYEGVRTIFTKDDRHTAEGINAGLKVISPESEYILYINDDVILTKNCLSRMIEAVGDEGIMANAISPCDNYLTYTLIMGFHDKNGDYVALSDRFYEYEHLKDHFQEMMNAESIYPMGTMLQAYLCMYATLIPRKVFDKVGLFDENFKTGQCDLDYCIRAQREGFKTITVLNALIWHFGGRTSSHTLNTKIRRDNILYFKEKWGFLPPGITEEMLA